MASAPLTHNQIWTALDRLAARAKLSPSGLAKRSGTVLLNGSGFDGPPWSVRISLANLEADAYEQIGRDLKDLMSRAFAEWLRSQGRHS